MKNSPNFEEADRLAREYYDLIPTEEQRKEHFSRMARQVCMFQERFNKTLKKAQDIKRNNLDLTEKLSQMYNLMTSLLQESDSLSLKLKEAQLEIYDLKYCKNGNSLRDS